MKNIFKYLFGGLFAAGLMASCQPEKFEGLDQAGIPEVSKFSGNVKASVDANNQMTLELADAKGYFPVWEIELPNGKVDRSTNNAYQKIYPNSGDYKIKLRVGNRNGISDGQYETTLHIANSIVDFSKYHTLLSKAAWHIANKENGHLGCGPSASDPASWWSADPDNKAEFGVYNNELTFANDKDYTFDPGSTGTMYVNVGCSIYPEYNTTGADFCVPVETQKSTYSLDVDGDDLILKFPKGTYFPYIANDDMWNEPRYIVKSINSKKMTLVSSIEGISWQYILTTENTVEKKFEGFKYDQPDNIWKSSAKPTFKSLYYAHGNSWEGYPDYEHSEGDNLFKVSLPGETNSQWQAQYQLQTELDAAAVPAGATYDMSVVFRSNTELPGVTIKLTDQNDEGAIVVERVPVPADEDYVFYVTDRPGIDLSAAGPLKLVFDFGGNPENTEVTIKNIVLIDHSKNTELDKLPGQGGEGEEEKPTANWTGANLLDGANMTEVSKYYAHGDSWEGYPDYESSIENGVHTISLPGESNSQWQAQYTLNNTGVVCTADKKYDIRVVITSSEDHPGATVKFTQQDNDDVYITADRHALEAGENVIEIVDVAPQADITNLKVVFDFGGNAAGTEIKISQIHLQEHKASGVTWVDVNSEQNLMTAGTLSVSGLYWAAGDDWHSVAEAQVAIEGRNANISIAENNGTNQWQGQVHLATGVAIEQGQTYDFSITFNASQDYSGVTVKPHPEGDDDHFFSQDRHDLAMDEDTKVTVVGFVSDFSTSNLIITLDFPGSVAGTTINVKDIIIQKAN